MKVVRRVYSMPACALALAFSVAATCNTTAQAQEFYAGKTITLLVGYAAGGGYDVNARMLSRHLGEHIPGHPAVLVMNMPGAGTLRALEYLQRTAPKDGTVIGLFDFTQITNSLLTPQKVQVDFRKFKWIGSIAKDLAVCYVWHTRGARTLADVQKLSVVHMGRTNPGSSSDLEQKIFSKIFNVKVQSVAGYAGSSEAVLAVERGELDGGCLTWSSLPPNWMAQNKIVPILKLSSATAADLPASVPNALDIAPDKKSQQIIRMLTASGEVGKPFVVPLSVPDDRVAVLREGFAATVKDPAFLADAERLHQPVSPTLGTDATKILDDIYATPPDVVDAARAVASD